MEVLAFRAQPYYLAGVDIDDVIPGTVHWTSILRLNGHCTPLPCFVLTCKIPYPLAVSLNLASGCHDGSVANIFLYKKDNKRGTPYWEGYRRLCGQAGPKPSRR